MLPSLPQVSPAAELIGGLIILGLIGICWLWGWLQMRRPVVEDLDEHG